MCGIAVAAPTDAGFVEFALSRQQSRGPDQTVTVDLGFCTLGVNRLAISGVTDGPQPLTSDDGTIQVVFNGAIYNAPFLIKEFGMKPRSTNDGEVIAFLYERFGVDFANYLEGMFAICVADSRRSELVVAVDQVGIKPMYVAVVDESWYVASVVAAFPPDLRPVVRRVPPGVVWSSSGHMQRIEHVYYHDGPLGDLLTRSVEEQIPLEVPWGCMLSGGVDSSLIAALASRFAPGLRTFTCGTKNGADLAAAREVADLLGSNHHEILVDSDELPQVVDDVVEATASFERWTVMAGVGTYLLARYARRTGLKVLMSGEGADELFAGYDEFQDIPEAFLNTYLLQYQYDLGASECLRLDRGTMAHSIEARVPFLSTSIMRFCRALAPSDKVRVADGRSERKFALRQFARTILPEKVAFRRKEEFTNGSGLTIELRRIAEQRFSIKAVADLRASIPLLPVDDPLSAWFVSRWLAIFGTTIGTDWGTMVDRGLFRQRVSPYVASAKDFATYRKVDFRSRQLPR